MHKRVIVAQVHTMKIDKKQSKKYIEENKSCWYRQYINVNECVFDSTASPRTAARSKIWQPCLKCLFHENLIQLSVCISLQVLEEFFLSFFFFFFFFKFFFQQMVDSNLIPVSTRLKYRLTWYNCKEMAGKVDKKTWD